MEYKELAEQVEKAIIGYNLLNGGVRSRPRTEALKNILFNNHQAILAALKGTAVEEEGMKYTELIKQKDEEIDLLNRQLDESDKKMIQVEKELKELKKAAPASSTKPKKSAGGSVDG